MINWTSQEGLNTSTNKSVIVTRTSGTEKTSETLRNEKIQLSKENEYLAVITTPTWNQHIN